MSKNVFILPTDKPSRLHLWTDENGSRLALCELEYSHTRNTQNIYITSDEEIKEGDWCYDEYNKVVFKNTGAGTPGASKKIILTTDPDLIKEGVQPIPDEFLEWFVKNPNCQFVKVIGELDEVDPQIYVDYSYNYKIIIPKQEILDEMKRIEEQKQETLKEFIDEELEGVFFTNISKRKEAERLIELGAKWQTEKMYSEANKIMIFLDNEYKLGISDKQTIERIKWYFETYFEKFKNK